jgi:hypothetical protein
MFEYRLSMLICDLYERWNDAGARAEVRKKDARAADIFKMLRDHGFIETEPGRWEKLISVADPPPSSGSRGLDGGLKP